MEQNVKPKDFAEAVGISPAYASMILRGVRPASSDIAISAFRTFGLRLGLLAEMTDADIDKLCGRCGPVDHAAADSADPAAEAAGKSDDITARKQGIAA